MDDERRKELLDIAVQVLRISVSINWKIEEEVNKLRNLPVDPEEVKLVEDDYTVKHLQKANGLMTRAIDNIIEAVRYE